VGCGAAFARLDNFAAGSAAGSDHPKARLRNRFEETLLLGAEAVVNGAGADRVWNTANLSFPGVSGEALLARLDMEGLAASRGSACASGVVKASHVLSSMGIERDLVNSAVRFSFLPSVTESEIDRGAEIVKSCVKELRKN
jgi:cysteine desulfurase